MRKIISMNESYKESSLEFVKTVFTEYSDAEEGNPQNYRARGFVTSSDYGILPGESVDLPAVECLMVKELEEGALGRISGIVEYSDYKSLT